MRLQAYDLRELARFLLTGITATVVNLSVLWAVRPFLGYGIALCCGTFAGFTISFAMSKMYAFRSRSWRKAHTEGVRFIAVYAFGAGVSWLISYTLGRHVLLRILDPNRAELIGALFGASSMALTSYIGHRFFTYKTHRQVVSDCAVR